MEPLLLYRDKTFKNYHTRCQKLLQESVIKLAEE